MSKKTKNVIVKFVKEEDGIGVVEVILILVVLIGLVIVFREQVEGIVGRIFDSINKGVNGLL